MVESPLLTATCRACHASRQISESLPLQSHGYQMPPTLTVSVVCQSPLSTHSCTLHLPPPHHMLSVSPHHISAPTRSPGSSETLASQLLPPVMTGPGPAAGGVWECSCQCRLWGGVENAYQELEIVAIGRGRETDFSELAKVKQIQTPRAL